MNRKILLAVALTATAFALPAGADHDRHEGSRRIEPGTSQHYDYAKVIGVKPVYRSVQVSEPRRECWEEPVTRYHSAGGGSAVPLIVGGIIGGIAGNQFGSGSGNVAMTTAGALLGGALAGDVSRQHGGYSSQPRTSTSYERRCQTRTSYHDEERLDGYRVDYKYRGRVYSTHMDEHPGERIKVHVSVDVTPQRY